PTSLGELVIGRLGLADGALVGDPDHRVESRIDLSDVLEVGPDDLLGGQPSVPDGAGQPGSRGADRVSHAGIVTVGSGCASRFMSHGGAGLDVKHLDIASDQLLEGARVPG